MDMVELEAAEKLYNKAKQAGFRDEAILLQNIFHMWKHGNVSACTPVTNKYREWFYLKLEQKGFDDLVPKVLFAIEKVVDEGEDFFEMLEEFEFIDEEGPLGNYERKVDRLRKQMKELQLEVDELKKFKKRVVSAIESEE